MLRGFFKGGLIGSIVVATLVLGLFAVGGGRAELDVVVVLAVASAFFGTGVGGVIGAVRATAGRRRWVLRPRRRLAGEAPGETIAPDPRLRLTVSAIYALAASTLGSMVVLGVLGRRDVTLWVGALVPFDVTPVHARAMVAGTLFVATFAAIAGLTLRVGTNPGGLGPAEQRLVAGAGFMAGLLALPSLAVILG